MIQYNKEGGKVFKEKTVTSKRCSMSNIYVVMEKSVEIIALSLL